MKTSLIRGLLSLCLVSTVSMASSSPATPAGAAPSLPAKRAEEAAAAWNHDRATIPKRTTRLAAESAAARRCMEDLRAELVAVAATDDTATARAIQVELALYEVRAAAAEEEKSLWDKQLEEAEKEKDLWPRRIQALEFERRLDFKVLLAGPGDVAERERRLAAAKKELDSQQSQIRKYLSRQETAAARWEDFDHRLARVMEETRRLEKRRELASSIRLARALAGQAVQLRRSRDLQAQWFLLYKALENRAWRNLSFARANVRVQQEYVDALARKEATAKATEAQEASAAADQKVTALQAEMDGLLAATKKDLAAIPTEAQFVAERIGAGQDAEARSQARRDYEALAMKRAAGEARVDFLKEYQSWQKAVAAFAKEKAERARSAAEEKSLKEIEQERRVLEESRRTSEEYVKGFASVLSRIDSQVDAARRGLMMDPLKLSGVSSQIVEAVTGAVDPERATRPAELAAALAVLAQELAAAATNEAGAQQWVYRQGQFALTQVRQEISKQWLDNTTAAIDFDGQRIASLLWKHEDRRLGEESAQETINLFQRMGHEAGFAVATFKMRITRAAGYAGRRAIALGAVIGALLLLVLFRGVGSRSGALAAAALAVVVSVLFRGNLMAIGLTLLLAVVAVYLALRAMIARGCSNGGLPSGGSLGGGLLNALRMIVTSLLFLVAFRMLAGVSEGGDDVRALGTRLWIIVASFVGVRLLFHPSLGGQLICRRAEESWLRVFGAGLAYACMVAAMVAIIPFALSLDTLGQLVLRTVVLSFVLVGAGLLLARVALGALCRPGAANWIVAGVRMAQTALTIGTAGAVVWVWSGLIDRLLLAPNAPEAAHQLVALLSRSWQGCFRFWHMGLSGGMTVASLTRGLIVFVASFWVARAVKRVFVGRVLSRTPMDEATRQTFATILGYLVIVTGFITGLNVAGSSLQNLALLAGAITVGLGFGLQNVINNFVSSLLINFGRTIRIGDYIDVGGTRGTVKEIGLRHTVMVTDDGITVLVPNGSLVSANIINWTNPRPRIRLHVVATVTRQADLAAVTQMLVGQALKHELVLRDPAPTVEVRSVAADKIGLELLAWIERPQAMARIVGEISLEVDRLLREKGLVA